MQLHHINHPTWTLLSCIAHVQLEIDNMLSWRLSRRWFRSIQPVLNVSLTEHRALSTAFCQSGVGVPASLFLIVKTRGLRSFLRFDEGGGQENAKVVCRTDDDGLLARVLVDVVPTCTLSETALLGDCARRLWCWERLGEKILCMFEKNF